jgi:hypothetical protein
MTYDGSDPDSDGVVEADVDNESVSTDELGGKYPSRVRAVNESGVVALIDPDSSSSPVTDAVDALISESPSGNAWNGTLILPSQPVENDGPINLKNNATITTYGGGYGEVQFTSDTIGLDVSGSTNTVIRGGLKLTGPGWDTGTNPAVYTDLNSSWHSWDFIFTEDWGGASLYAPDVDPLYMMHVGLWRARRHDPEQNTGNSNKFIFNHRKGISNTFGTVILANPSNVPSGTTPGGYSSGAYTTVGTLEVLGGIGDDLATPPVLADGIMCMNIGLINHEPIGVSMNELTALIRTKGMAVNINFARVAGRDVNRISHAFEPTSSRFPPVSVKNAAHTGNALRITDPPTGGPSRLLEEQSMIQDSTGTTGWSHGIECVDGYYKP